MEKSRIQPQTPISRLDYLLKALACLGKVLQIVQAIVILLKH
jgi:hypothetical protein